MCVRFYLFVLPVYGGTALFLLSRCRTEDNVQLIRTVVQIICDFVFGGVYVLPCVPVCHHGPSHSIVDGLVRFHLIRRHPMPTRINPYHPNPSYAPFHSLSTAYSSVAPLLSRS